jgi:hypothetical protein
VNGGKQQLIVGIKHLSYVGRRVNGLSERCLNLRRVNQTTDGNNAALPDRSLRIFHSYIPYSHDCKTIGVDNAQGHEAV